jgi:uncharacterized SAM-binding protein YcdF (DUF218 family)
MFFLMSKALSPFTDPVTILGLLIVASIIGLWSSRPLLALYLQSASAALLLMLSVLPGASWLALPLETRFQLNPLLPDHIAGIIALGGTERVAASNSWNQPLLNDPTPIATLIALGRRYPEARLVFSGGGSIRGRKITEADIVRRFVSLFGVNPDRITYEDRSRNTLENGVNTYRLLRPAPSEQWILVTQAISMPRAVGVFRKAGWNIIPFPAGYLTSNPDPGLFSSNLVGGLELASVASHEWIGLIAYRIMGYTSELLPGRG